MSTINAITSPAPAIVTTVDSTGNLVMQAVNSIQLQSGSNTATMPAAAGTVMVSGNMPTFSAYLNTNQALTVNTATKVQCNTKEWDTASCYDNATNYRFTPNVAGYYQVSGGITSQADCYAWVAVYKNGSLWKYLFDSYNASASGTNVRKAFGSCLVYLNGSTDYIELYATIGASENIQGANNALTYFQGALVRSA